MAYAGLPPASFTNNLTNVQLIDDISSSFNGSTQTFALTTNSSPFHAVSARSLLVTLGGVTQKPQVDYTVDGANITFTTAPVNGLTFAARNIYGLNYLNNVNDGVITPSKLSTGAPTWNTGGNVGIGTDNPGTLLDVRGSTESAISVGTTSQFYGRLYGSSTLTFVGAYNGADLSLSTSNATSYNSKIMIKNGGNVGIGTTDPSQPLVVENSATNTLLLLKATGSSAARLIFKNTGMTSDGDTQIWSQNNDLVFNTSNSEQVRIDSNGKVGIGTNDPDGGDLLGTPALTVYGTTPIVNISQSQDFDSDADIGKLVFAANDPRTTSSQNGREMAFMKARWVGSSTDTLDTSVSIYTAQDGGAASTYERVRITPNYGLTGNIVQRFIPPGIYYYNAGTPGLISNSSIFFSANAAMMNETGDKVWFGGWPTAYAHKKFVAVRMIYHGSGNVNGTVWSVSADIYWAVALQGYTQNGTTINFDLPSISNGKVYIKDITSIWPVIGSDRVVNSQFTFTENIGGSTIGITGLQIVEATNPYG